MHASSVRALSRQTPAHRSRTVFGGRERDVTREERCAPQDSRSSRAATPVPQTPPRATPDLSPPSPSVSRTPATETGHAPRGLRPRRPGDARALQVRLPAPHPLPAAATHANLLFAILETASAPGRGIFSLVDADEGARKTKPCVQEVFCSPSDDAKTTSVSDAKIRRVASDILTTARVSNTSLTCAVRLFFFQKFHTTFKHSQRVQRRFAARVEGAAARDR